MPPTENQSPPGTIDLPIKSPTIRAPGQESSFIILKNLAKKETAATLPHQGEKVWQFYLRPVAGQFFFSLKLPRLRNSVLWKKFL